MGYRTFAIEQIIAGKMPYIDKVQLRGYNAAVSNSAETLWSPGATYAQLTAAAAMEAVSSSAADAAAGTGARTIRVTGVDGNYKVITEDVTLNGTSVVALTKTYIAINELKVLTAGSGFTNAGDIDVRVVSGSVVKARIPNVQGFLGQKADFIYTIPVGYLGVLSPVSISASGVTGTMSAYVQTKDSTGVIKGEGQSEIGISNTSINPGYGIIDFQGGLLVTEKTLIEGRAIVSAGAGIAVAMAQLVLFDVKNNGLI